MCADAAWNHEFNSFVCSQHIHGKWISMIISTLRSPNTAVLGKEVRVSGGYLRPPTEPTGETWGITLFPPEKGFPHVTAPTKLISVGGSTMVVEKWGEIWYDETMKSLKRQKRIGK